jgi:8-oxo-dGTP pyrophosphatase MutT (NUDIX family)
VNSEQPSYVLSPDELRSRLHRCPCERIEREGFRRASVLLPLLPRDGSWHVLLTRRADDLEHHRGQVAFPGGSIEGDESALEAALRETEEEIGVPRSAVDVLGTFSDIWTPTGFIITPFAGLLDPDVEMHPNPAEVARIFTGPLAFFTRPENVEEQEVDIPGMGRRTVPYYHVAGETVWGATALILRQFLVCTGLIALC